MVVLCPSGSQPGGALRGPGAFYPQRGSGTAQGLEFESHSEGDVGPSEAGHQPRPHCASPLHPSCRQVSSHSLPGRGPAHSVPRGAQVPWSGVPAGERLGFIWVISYSEQAPPRADRHLNFNPSLLNTSGRRTPHTQSAPFFSKGAASQPASQRQGPPDFPEPARHCPPAPAPILLKPEQPLTLGAPWAACSPSGSCNPGLASSLSDPHRLPSPG